MASFCHELSKCGRMDLWLVEHFFSSQQKQSKSEEKSVQLSKRGFITNDFLRNPHFSVCVLSKIIYTKMGIRDYRILFIILGLDGTPQVYCCFIFWQIQH